MIYQKSSKLSIISQLTQSDVVNDKYTENEF